MAARPKLRALKRFSAAYALEQGFPDFLSLAASRIGDGATVSDVALELRPLFANRAWGPFPSRPMVESLLNRMKDDAGTDALSIARRNRRLSRRVAHQDAQRNARFSFSTPTAPTPPPQVTINVRTSGASTGPLQLTARPVVAGLASKSSTNATV